jgi:hypothetical protein
MAADARRRAFSDGERARTLVRDNDGWAWTVIFTVASLCWLSLGVLLLLSPA